MAGNLLHYIYKVEFDYPVSNGFTQGAVAENQTIDGDIYFTTDTNEYTFADVASEHDNATFDAGGPVFVSGTPDL
tara:strand:- start:193 stop:417 length:225 start_codon:yes stop_codon:yes gene_type:complete